MSTLGALNASRTTLTIPLYGTAFADVLLENGAAPSAGPATLTVAGLAFAGTATVLRADLDAPDLPHVAWAQAPGWDKPLSARGYSSPQGVRLLTVLRDLALDTGETFASLPADATMGVNYTRVGSTPTAPSTGAMALEALRLAGWIPAWWVDAVGLTHLEPRPGGAAQGRVDVMRRNAAVGLRVIGIDAPAGFLPGTTIEGVVTRKLVVKERGRSLSAEAWG